MASGEVDAGYVVARFLVRRLLALGYAAAFLSLLSQVDGLFGCGGLYKSKVGAGPALPLFLCCNVGAALASASLLGARPLERQPVISFLVLWVLYAASVSLAAPALPALEDKLLLEAGLACLPLVARDGGRGGRVGRALVAWVLFRASFGSASEQLGGECPAWRQLTALGYSYQLTAFPMPLAWPVSQAPVLAVQAVTALHLYANTVVALLIVTPWRCLAVPAVLLHLALAVGDTLLANLGVTGICKLALTCALLSDWWHRSVWSTGVLKGWGCELPPAGDTGGKADDSGSDGEKERRANGDDNRTRWFHPLAPLAVAAGFGVALSVLARGPATLDDLLAPVGFSASAEALQRIIGGGAIFGTFVALLTLLVAASRAPGFQSLLALLVWAAGSVQLARDTRLAEALPPFEVVGGLLEAGHLAHRLTPELPCPREEGRKDVVFQGMRVSEDPNPDAPPQRILDLSSKLLPSSAERRPTWFQPYSPRLELELWRYAQNPGETPPLWAKRLAAGLALRQGSAARLAVGHWDGVGAKLYQSQGESDLGVYSKLEPPLSALRVLRVTHKFVEDKHSNKWWNLTDADVLKLYTGEDLDKLLKKHGSAMASHCAERLPWEGLPVAEAMLALMCASLLGTLLLRSGGGARSGSSDGKKAKAKGKTKKA